MRNLNLFPSLLFSLCMTSHLAEAESYQTEIGLNYTDVASVIDSYALGAEYYFNPVSTEQRPWAEAAFMQRESGIYGIYSTEDTFFDASVDLLLLGGEFYIETANLYIALELVNSELEVFDSSERDNSANIKLGFSPSAGLLITTTYNTETDYELNLTGRYVTDMKDGHAHAFEMSFFKAPEDEYSELDNGFEFEYDYYIDPTFSIGVLFNNTAGGLVSYGVDDNAVGLRLSKFFTPQFGVRAEYQKVDDESIKSLSLAIRF